MHTGMNLIPSAVQKAGIDKYHSVFSSPYAFLKVDRSASLLVHNAHFDSMPIQAQSIFDTIEQVVGEANLFRTMHLGFHYIDTASPGVVVAARQLNILHRNQAGNHAVHNAFRNLRIVAIENRRIGHKVPHVAHKHKAAPAEGDFRAICSFELPVGIHAADKGFTIPINGLL